MGENRFSYFELTVLALLLGMLIFVNAPEYISAGEHKKICSLIDGLELMRAQISLYQAEHNGKLPPCDSYESFENALTTEDGQYGPYIDEIPVNPFNGLRKVRFDGESAGKGQAGWRLNTKTGMFKADSSTGLAKL